MSTMKTDKIEKKRNTSSAKKQKSKKKMTVAERQEIKLKRQKERQAKKIANGEAIPKNKDRFYCTSAELTAELEKWRDSNIEEERERIKNNLEIDYSKRVVSEELGKMLIMIADKMLNRNEFRNYSKEIKEEAKSYFFLRTIKDALKNYNFKFNNPFAYLSTCAWNAYLAVIVKHYRHQNMKKDLMRQQLSDIENYSGIDPNSSLSNYIKRYLDLDDYGPIGKNKQ